MSFSIEKSNKDIFKIIRELNPLEEKCRELGITFFKIGRTIRANSPFYSGGKNAFCINGDFWFDFSVPAEMQNSGDVLDLVAILKFNGDKKRALEELAPEEFRKNFDAISNERKNVQRNIDIWHENLISQKSQQAKNALEYLKKRHVDEAQIKRLKIGFNFEHRIVFPCLNTAGDEFIFYTSRALGNLEPKYKNAPVQKKFLRSAPMGLNTLKKGFNLLVITEGVFDFLAFEALNVPVLASLGNDLFSKFPDFINTVKNFKKICLAYDNDEKGFLFSHSAAEILFKHNIHFSVIDIPKNFKDIADCREHELNLSELVANAEPGIFWLAKSMIFGFSDNSQNKNYFENLPQVKINSIQKEIRNFLEDAVISGLDDPDLVTLSNALSKSGVPANWLEAVVKEAKKTPSQAKILSSVLKKFPYLFYSGSLKAGLFFDYDKKSGCWSPVDDALILNRISDTLGAKKTGGLCQSVLTLLKGEVIDKGNEKRLLLNSLPIFQFKNGVLNLNSEQFSELDPKNFSTFQVSYNYNPAAKCDLWLDFIDKITLGEQSRKDLLQLFTGYCLFSDCSLHKSLFIIGSGSNGKSTFLDVIAALFENSNQNDKIVTVTNIQPKDFEDATQRIALEHSLVNIARDIDPNLKGTDSFFKSIVAGDSINGNLKFHDTHAFTSRAKLLSSCNSLPFFSEASQAIKRRLLFCNFEAKFEGKNKDTQLTKKLLKELSGIFNWAFTGYRKLRFKNFQLEPCCDQKKLIDDMSNAINPLLSFWEEYEEEFLKENYITRENIFSYYSSWCNTHAVYALPANQFHRKFIETLEGLGFRVKESQPRIDGKRTRIYVLEKN